MSDLDKMMEFCIDNRLTVSQYILLYYTYFNNVELLQKYANVASYEGKLIGPALAQDLIDKGLVVKENGTYKVTEKFTNMFVDKNVITEQLLKAYPTFVTTTNGTNLPLKLVSLEELKALYFEAIGGSKEEHYEVLKDIKYGKDNGLIKGKIDTFVKSKFWLSLRDLRLSSLPLESKSQDDFESLY